MKSFIRLHGLYTLAFLLLAWSRLSMTAGGIAHVLVVGCDGFGSIAFNETNTPVLHSLMRNGAWTLKARAVMPTSSSPNWASMIMGAGPEQHGVTSNEWETNKFEIAPTVVGTGGMFPTIFGVLRQQRPNARIACVHDWDGFGRLLEPTAPNILENVKGSAATAARAIEIIKQHKPDFLFVHFDEVDHAGHEYGWGSKEYFAAVEKVDGLIGDLLRGLQDEHLLETTLIVMTADHGGKAKSHGGLSMAEIEIPLILSGPGVRRGRELDQPVNTYDLAPTLAWVLDLQAPACWIGKVVAEAFEVGDRKKP